MSRTEAADSSDVVQRFEAEAAFWQEIFGRADVQSVIHQRRLGLAIRLVDQLGLPSGATVLEVGAGAGQLAVALARRGYRVSASDPAPRMRELIRANAAAAGVQARLEVLAADARALPFAASQFDMVAALGVLPWLTDPRTVIDEMVRVVRPRGYLIVTCVSRTPLPMLLDPLRHPALGPLRDRVRLAAARARGTGLARRPRPPTWLSPAGMDDLLIAAGLSRVDGVAFGYGPLTWLGRRAFPDPVGAKLDARIQRFGSTHPGFARRLATQYIILARTPGS